MIALYKLYIVCVVLCTVHSYSITGTIKYEDGAVHAVNISDYISGENWINTRVLTLNRLEGSETLPALTIANFKYLTDLYLMNIALESVPVFENTICSFITITGNKIESVPANAFSGPRPMILDLSNNQIHSMADRSVNVDAKDVKLKCNKITHFSQSWFEKLDNVETLDLSGNRIVHIQDRAFNQMTMLENVHLGNNQITSIGSEAFGKRINNLNLEFNNIVQITSYVFAYRNRRISTLHLHHNQLNYLPEALMLKLKPRYISLFGNPWQCQCLRDIERRLRRLNSTRRDVPSRRGEPVCVEPLSFQNICMPTVDRELQQTYAQGLSPVQGCWATPCQCSNINNTLSDNLFLAELT